MGCCKRIRAITLQTVTYEMKKNSEMTEDEQKISDKNVQDLTDKFIKEIDVLQEWW